MEVPGYTKAWVAWLAASAASFAVIEAKAIQRGDGATLTAHLHQAFGFDDSGPLPRVRRTVFYAGWGWFGLHLLRRTTRCVSCISPPTPPT
jgi:hypothetical protein